MTAQDLTALADKLDKLGADALAQGHKLADPLSHAWNEAAKDQSASFRRGVALVEQHRTLLAASAALREAARMREALQGLLNAEADFEGAQQSGNPGHRYASYARLKEAREAARAALESPHGA